MKNRLKLVQIFLFLGIITISARLWYWQIIKSDDMIAKAESQRTYTKTIIAPRGNILFSDGTLLATYQPTYLVFAQPKLISDKSQAAKKLAPIFWENRQFKQLPANNSETTKKTYEEKIKTIEQEILNNLSKDLFWISLERRVSSEMKDKIEKLNLKGIGFDTYLTRFSPEGSSSAHLLGFVGSDVYGVDTGYFGLEGFYNGELKGKNGELLQDRDAQGLPILIGTYKVKEPKPGKTLLLNIDRTVQTIVEESLKKGIKKYGAEGASAVVMDPRTGNILGLASFPNYDPALPTLYLKEYYKNAVTAGGFEPGSTFKILVAAAGINEGVITPDTICDICSGPVNISRYSIRTWNNKYKKDSTMTDVIVNSDNTGMVFIGRKLGLDKLYEYLEKFGIGKITGVDLQDEYSPDLRPKNEWREIDVATATFGQGISVTPIQIVKAVGVIANGGIMMEPHVVKAVKDEKSMYQVSSKEVARPITPETAKQVTEMMVKAVEAGESKFAKPKGYKVAGKTGTAQIPIAGKYDPSKTIASFVGFAPVFDPKFVMLVRFDQPRSSIYGSETAAPTFFEIAKELFIYFNIPPTE